MTDAERVCEALRDDANKAALRGATGEAVKCRALADYIEAADLQSLLVENARSVLTNAHPAPEGGGSCPLEAEECSLCSARDCPYMEPLHYHHDGCPMCDMNPPKLVAYDAALARLREVLGP